MIPVIYKSESVKKLTNYSCCINDCLNSPGFNLSVLGVALVMSSACKAPGFKRLLPVQVYLKYLPLTKNLCQREGLRCDQALRCLQQQLSVTAPNGSLGSISPRAIPATAALLSRCLTQ